MKVTLKILVSVDLMADCGRVFPRQSVLFHNYYKCVFVTILIFIVKQTYFNNTFLFFTLSTYSLYFTL